MNLLLVVYKKIELSVGFLHVLTHSLHITITCLFFFLSLSPDHKQTKTKRKEKKEKRKENARSPEE